MTDAVAEEPDEPPPPESSDQASNPETRSPGSGRLGLFTPLFFVAATVALMWTVVLLGLIATTIDVVSAIAAYFVSFVGVLTGIVGVFQPPRFPRIEPKVTRGVVIAILAVDSAVSAGWGGWSYYQANRPVDVLSQIRLDKSTSVLPGGHSGLDVDIAVRRTQIELVFQAADTNSGAGSCVPNTEFSLTPTSAGNRGAAVAATPGASVRLDLPDGIRHLHLDIAVTNTRDDRNCAVDLFVISAKLLNG